jgi:hypothetical protein
MTIFSSALHKEPKMNVTFVSRDLVWTEPMCVWVNHKIALPIQRALKTDRFELSVHWELSRGRGWDEPKYELWTVLQTYDGRGNQILRRRGNDFCNLVEEISKDLSAQVRRARLTRRFSLNFFSPFQEAACDH